MQRIAHKTHLLASALVLTAGLSLAACGQPTEVPVPTEAPTAAAMEVPTEAPTAVAMATDDMLVTLENDGRFTTLLGLVAMANLTDTLKGAGPYTLFAPTDDAFAALPAGTLDGLTPEQVSAILMYHLVGTPIMAADARRTTDAMTTSSESITMMGTDAFTATLKSDGANVMINDANVTAGDILAINGVIHIIDKVLMPPAPAAEGDAAMAGTPEATAEGGSMDGPTAMPEASPTP